MLGVWDGHDAGAAVLVDGVVRGALSEERLTRRKRQSGFPSLALQAVLDDAGVRGEDLDAVAVAGQHGRLLHRALDSRYAASDADRDPLALSSRVVRRLETAAARLPQVVRSAETNASHRVLSARLRSHGIVAPLHLVDHHHAHAQCARLAGPWRDALVVTADGYGDGLAMTVSDENGCGTNRSTRATFPSPGWSAALVYGAATRVLGFQEGDEGKLMGLAAHGDASVLRAYFDRLLTLGACDPRLGGTSLRRTLEGHRREDVAAALQTSLEAAMVAFVAARRGAHRRVLLAGGLFANAVLNARLMALFPDGGDAFPHMGDGGLCVGAAAALFEPELARPLPLPFLGPRRTLDDGLLGGTGLHVTRHEHAEDALLTTILAGGYAARWLGRSEFGPRALGHRSILLLGDDPRRTAELNARLDRDGFMPFAPIRRTGAGTPTMTAVVAADALLRERCPAAVHADGTARTQLVDAAEDPALDRLLAGAEAHGHPALINTSFNRHGEPIVETAADAIVTFLNARLDALQLGPNLVATRVAA